MDFFKSFLVGGFICFLSQIIVDKTKITSGKLMVYLVVLGCFLGGMGIYDKLVDFAGAGATVPITGFGYLLCQGVKKSIDENGFSGILSGGLSACSGGISAVVLLSFFSALIFNPKEK